MSGFVAASAARISRIMFLRRWDRGGEKKFQLALGLFFADGKELFFFLGHVAQFQRHRIRPPSGECGEVFFDLLELAMLVDDRFEIGVLLGEFLKRVESVTTSSGEFLGHFLVAGVELIEFFQKA